MKKLISLILPLFVTLSLWACGDEAAEPEPAAPAVLQIQSTSILENEEISPSTEKVEVVFDKMIKLVGREITLNGQSVEAQVNAFTLIVPLKLAFGTQYTLEIPAGSVVSSMDNTIRNEKFTLSFHTEAYHEFVNNEPMDEEATSECRNLFRFISQNYREKTLSCAMADVNWNYNIAKKVKQLTGKYPAMNCFDFIHISVPKNNWIDYTDLTPVTEWAAMGGVVSLMWHFNVPVDENTTPNASGGGTSFYADKTTFRPHNALTDGTWENRYFYAEMEKVADVILRLQEAGIPALWRPFHEAAGNYYAKGWKGSAWFWWGADGPDVYRELWHAMHVYFQQRGIHNLIWVWTSQHTNGGTAEEDGFEPDITEYDIVARDYYGSSADQLFSDFAGLSKTYNQKLVALGECGYGDVSAEMPLFSSVWGKGARYLFVMPWCGGSLGTSSIGTMVSDAWWKDLMQMPNVITMDNINIEEE